ncbi:Regulatory protein SoxS [Streptomyces sp. YIM 130001]|uniref:helix-turn-helix transcriptional regulator n=1 Tax=Streptomyces sp. YIM 130001 TaxID=2259644 RepID=UPI000E6545AA|nr:helix-turn-helix transcriptional regulator [Streptomyces sp. YIM 130001]RII12490.1 Regulatory protein SoxS [Streptomyces sp. YIM 130001]
MGRVEKSPGGPGPAQLAQLRRMRLAKDAMDRDWADPGLDLDAVATHAGYSRFHFVRAFRAAYGETPGQYLSRRRIERAGDLLRTANLSVTEICHLVGFSSLGTFCTRFKQQTGFSPREYRGRNAGPAAAMIPGCHALLWAGGFPGRTAQASEVRDDEGPSAAQDDDGPEAQVRNIEEAE